LGEVGESGPVVALLRERNRKLEQQVADAVQALDVFARGEVDAVALRDASATPILLEAAQQKLRRSEALLRAIFDGSLDAKLLADDAGRYIDANPAACELFGLAREQLLGRSLLEFAAADYDAGASQRAVQGRGQMRALFPLRRPDGVRRILEYGTVANVAPGLHLISLRDVTERVGAEDELRASRTMLQEAQEIAHVGSWISGLLPDGYILFSREAARIFGLPEESPVAVASFMAIVHPEDRARFQRATRAAIEHGAPADIEHRLQRPDGSVRWVHERGKVERDLAGRPLRLVGTVQDVTDRTRALEALRTSEAEFRLLAEAMPQIVWITRPDGYNVYFNQRWTDYTGLTLEESRGDGWTKPFHPEDKLLASEAWRSATATVGPYSLECRLRRADGVYLWWLIRGVPVANDEGTILKWFGTCTDIDALKRSESKLREQEAMLRIAGRTARLGGWSISLPDYGIVWSDELCGILEVAPGTVPSLEQAIATYAPEFQGIVRAGIEACVHDGTPFDLEVQIVTVAGRKVWVRIIGHAERASSGAITHLTGAFQDIDDRRKLQDQYRQAQKMEAVGRLAGGVAHDFNNLLSVILSYSELAIDDLKPGDPLRHDMTQIRTAAQRATGLTSQLLAFSRQQVMEPRVLYLNEIVGPMKSMLGRLLGEDIELTVLSPSSIGRVLVDPSQIEQVVMNLAVNARDAMPDGGKLTIATSELNIDETYAGRPPNVVPGRFVLLTVTDNGVGMTEATQARIFEPFFTTKEQEKGTGLGLSIVFGIAQQSGGYVSVHSEPGRGTTFNIYLPRTERVAEPAVIASSPPLALDGSETILLVEDEEQVRIVACAILRRHGYKVLEASNGGEALLISIDFSARIDLLLTDVVMPRVGGRRLAEQLALQRPEMKLLFASGYTDDAIIHHGVQDAGFAFLQKPFTPQALLKKVRDVLNADRHHGEGSTAGSYA
jgi:two-component system, cell cycle sensor histidine kinase and response regulator CckA